MKDINGNTPKEGNFVKDENGFVGLVKSIFMTDYKHTTNHERISVDFNSHVTELNSTSHFEVIEANEKMKKFFKVL